MSKQHEKAVAPKEEVKPVVPETPEPLVDESIQSHSAEVTEGEAAKANAEGVDLKEQPLDPHDGAQLDQKTETEEFDKEAEEKAAYAEPEEEPENIKHAIVNPNGVGSEWPRG